MKRIANTVVIIILIVLLSGCKTTPETTIEIPNFSGNTESMIIDYFDVEEYENYQFEYMDTDDEDLDGLFVELVNADVGDAFDREDTLIITILRYQLAQQPEYFQVLDMEYDGPLLDESFASIDYLDPRGGYFEVTLVQCTDGDTAVFDYPSDVYEAITSNAKSTRFLNMDTEESTNTKEEWGKPGSLYTCGLLEGAESIVLQTDPGDNLTGTYGRLLAWIWIQLPEEEDYQLLNYMVVKQGLAQVKFEFGAGETISYGEYTYNEWMHIAEDYAIENELGQWGSKLDYYWDYEENKPDYSRW
ncbi:thermonuclease family protein [Candidatus Xianfuyuplasma coldseepsis]|uniref:TNase-like domain-containing protein n=1 Tax=Candidatus Xianfuyuplasma coldseepsis TaxID=2782163 RepID=A0A7L7KQB2_9MOLU|nr:thermonuclease family protein [Xianfuyuplasma coldseepsis]QMS84981.1 hypothetical protein G4Z02_04165 [Xianfuyuplasma coldseepsis]